MIVIKIISSTKHFFLYASTYVQSQQQLHWRAPILQKHTDGGNRAVTELAQDLIAKQQSWDSNPCSLALESEIWLCFWFAVEPPAPTVVPDMQQVLCSYLLSGLAVRLLQGVLFHSFDSVFSLCSSHFMPQYFSMFASFP